MNSGADLKSILRRHGRKRDELIPILHDVQQRLGYITPEAVDAAAEFLDLSPAEVYGAVTFYKAFSLKPRGRNHVTACKGTACQVRGGRSVIEEIERRLGIGPGGLKDDGQWSFEAVNCLGCCSIGPVVVVNGKYHGHVTVSAVGRILGGGTAKKKNAQPD
jgi:NADH-quinone oxidoreductase subunit E